MHSRRFTTPARANTFAVLALSCFGMALTGTAAAQGAKPATSPLALCLGATAAPPERLSACTAVIEAGKEKGRSLATAYCNRGYALTEGKEYDKAIADLDRAIQLEAKLACSYV